MSSASEPPSPEPADPAGANQPSFVQRLRKHYGGVVDPEINLQGERADSESRSPADDASGSKGNSTSRGLVERLSQTISVRTRYGVDKEIARGGMGTILRVWDDDLRRNLAMKVMHGSSALYDPEDSSEIDQERLSRFLEEAQITGQLDHPGIVPVHDLGVDENGRCYFTMRLVRGRELKDIFDLCRQGKEGWTRTKVLGLVLKVCEAMAYAHSKGVVHRDLKPANIMVGRFGETYVMDWGLARVLGRRDTHDLRLRPTVEDPSAMSLVRTVRRDEQQVDPESPLVTMDGDVVGTPAYMSPEQARGKLEEVGPRSDVYSLGAILYYMLTGRSPYVAPGERVSPHTVLNRVLQQPPEPVRKLARAEPAELVAICEKAMARDPGQRYASMLEVSDDLQAYLENRVVGAYEGGSLAEFRKWVVRNKGVAASLCALGVLGMASAVGFGLQKQRQVNKLAEEQAATQAAVEKAEANLLLALDSEKRAKDSAEEALTRRAEADENAEQALRSGYMANILASDYSLKLNDIAEARRRLADCDRDRRGWEWDHLDLRANAALVSHARVLAGLSEVRFDGEGRRVMLLAQNGRVSFFERDSRDPAPPKEISASAFSLGKSFSRLPLNEKQRMALHPDGGVLAMVGSEKVVGLFDVESGAALRTVPAAELPEGAVRHAFTCTAVAFSPDGARLASGADNGEILVWAFGTGELLAKLDNHQGSITDLGWDVRGRYLASTSEDGTANLWDVGRERVLQILRGHAGPVHALVWAADGNSLFTSGEDSTINHWRASDGTTLRTLSGHTASVRGLDFDPRTGLLASASLDRTVRLWNVEQGTHEIFRGHVGGVVSVAFDPRGRALLAGAEDGEALLFDVHGDLGVTEFEYKIDSLQALEFSPDGSRILTGGRYGNTLLWDARSGEPLRRHFPTWSDGGSAAAPTFQSTNAVAFRADGKRYASAGHDKLVRIFETETGRPLGTIRGFEKWVQDLAFTPDGSRLITGSGDKVVRVHDAETTLLLHELRGHRSAVNSLRVSADGRWLASAGRQILVWNLEDLEEPPRVFETDRKSVRVIDFSPDGQHIVAGLMTGDALVFDLRAPEAVVSLEESGAGIWAAAYSPDGKRIALGSSDGRVRIVDARTMDVFLTLEHGDEKIEALAFSPDGTRLAMGGSEGRVRLWESGDTRARRQEYHDFLERGAVAAPVVEEMFRDYFFLSEVLGRLQQRADLSHELRETALRMALRRGDDPALLYRHSFGEALGQYADPTTLERAHERAAAAASMPGGASDPRVQLALGMAAYRTGRFEEAVAPLDRARALQEQANPLRPGLSTSESLVGVLFLAMARVQLAEGDAANTAFGVAEKLIAETPYLAFEPYMRELMLETQGLLVREGYLRR